MRKTTLLFSISLILLAGYSIISTNTRQPRGKHLNPAEEYLLSLQYPGLGEGLHEYRMAVLKEMNKLRKTRAINAAWQKEGPFNTGGRINCIAKHPTAANTYLIGCADGGIFKTTDDATTWTPIFDSATSLSVSSIVYDQANPNVIYAGTGDQVLGGYSHVGNGIYKSVNGGNTWTNTGLQNTGAITKIITDPSNSNIVYAATTGNPFISDSNRGVYKSIDAGMTWNRVLFLGLNAGIGDMVINPSNPSIIYATGRRRKRSDLMSVITGPEARIYRSTNAGASWDTLTTGLPTGNQCRIGLCISANNPNLLYANYVDTSLDCGGIYKTTNGGNSWTQVNNGSSISMGGFGWYFGEIRLDPGNDNTLYLLNVSLYKSTNGGTSFNTIGNTTHSDKHDMVFLSSSTLLLGTDGGFYKSTNAGNSWTIKNNMPITQFYEIAYNPFDTSNYYGGAQDNGTNYGSAALGLINWNKYYGADGFRPQFNHLNDQVFYAEWQNGGVVATDDGGMNFNSITNSLTATDRCSWNTPYLVSKHNPDVLYIGTYQVYKNTSGPVDSWTPISNDLTDGINDDFHVITTVHQSPINSQVLYAGTSDANVWVTQNDGVSWTQVNAGLSNRNISCVLAAPDTVGHVFVSQTGYRNNDSIPHLYFSNNYGATWTNIAGNLPNFSINDIWVQPGSHDSNIVIANDGGVYASKDRGLNWERVGNNMPIIPVFDLDYNEATHRLMVGTFARSMVSMAIDSIFPPKVVTPESVSTYTASASLQVYPNPCHDYFSIRTELQGRSSALLYDMMGSVVKRYPVLGDRNDCRGLSSGYYILSVLNGGKRVNRQLVIR